MKRILTAAQMKQADRNTIETMGVPSLVLMERAALSCVEELKMEHGIQEKSLLCAVPEIMEGTVRQLHGF